jgi:hypothetical protein
VVVKVNQGWLCVVVNRNLRGRGEDVVTREIAGLAGDVFMDFKVADDEFDGDFYAFVKCSARPSMERFRRSSSIVAVLESYDNPTYLDDSVVDDFLLREPERTGVRDGDMVAVGGEGVFSKLNGVVVLGGREESLVLFRFHTVTRREWISNEELIVTGNVFLRLKLPVRDASLFQADGRRYPVIMEEEDVDKGERDRGAD